jgi:hypothetical protein
MPALRASHDGQTFLPRDLTRGDDSAAAWWIDGDGFLDETMFPRRDGCLEMNRPKIWRSRQYDEINRFRHHLPVGVKSNKSPFRGNPELGYHTIDSLLEGVSHRIDFDFHASERRCFQQISEGAASASTAAYQTYLESRLRARGILGKQ